MLVCPKCNGIMHPSAKRRRVDISRCEHKVYLRCEILDISELFSLPVLSGEKVKVDFPLYEEVVFNFGNGHTFIRLLDRDGKSLAKRDVTNDKKAWSSGVAYDTVLKYKYVRRYLRKMFAAEHGGKIPFCQSEITVNELRMLTAFIGYNGDFYSAIPYNIGTLQLDGSFKRTAKGLHRADNAVKLYEASSLPQIKSVRKLFFEEQGMLFYIRECEALWHIIGDPNRFIKLLKSNNKYRLLTEIHTRPTVLTFFKAYAQAGKAKKLIKLLSFDFYSLLNYAVNYSSLSKHARLAEIKKWNRGEEQIGSHFRFNVITPYPNYSIPVMEQPKSIHNCIIDGFKFRFPKTSTDYMEAGKALNNCLKESYEIISYPVVAVLKNGKTVAAIEVAGSFVAQARCYNNGELSTVVGLEAAFVKWCNRFNLAETPDEGDFDFDDDDEDLPF